MRDSSLLSLGALFALLAAGCAVDRGGLALGEGGTPVLDLGRGDARLDAPGVDLGSDDLGSDDLGSDDLGSDDLGRDDLGPSDLGPSDLGPSCGAPRSHRSCRDLRDDACLTPAPATGIHEIDVDGAGGRAPFDVWCDMDIAGGGWTLYGRSDNTVESFGWMTMFGAPDVDSMPYSLGLGTELAFNEVIFGRRGGGKDWGAHPVFRFTVPAGFVTTYATTAYAITDLTTVQGGCVPPAGGPSMLRFTGHTSANKHFFFSSASTIADYGNPGTGLCSDGGFVLMNNMCAVSGVLDAQPGMIMVR